MKKLLFASVVLSLSVAVGRLGVAGPPPCATENGNVNGDAGRDLSDAIYTLAWLFQGGPAPGFFCLPAGPKEVGCAVENGNTNGDAARDLSDVIYLLAWLFQGGPAPVPKCAVVITGDPSRLPRTSTTPPTCYDAAGEEKLCTDPTCPGQDGFYDRTGCLNDPRFVLDIGPDGVDDTVDNETIDDTVTDTCTGLMWQRESADGGDGFLWCDALAYCEGLTFPAGGHDDWRLPSIRELESIVDYRRPPAFDRTVFPDHSNAHWSSTSVTPSPSNAWYVDFSGGQVQAANKTAVGNALRVRAVRSFSDLLLPDTGQTQCYDRDGVVIDDCTDDTHPDFGQDGFYANGCLNDPRFLPHDSGTPGDPDDDTVTDTCTGLMWQKSLGVGGTTFSWCDALEYCEVTLDGFAGHTDWRLPNPRELHSLIDYGRQGPPALNPLFNASVGRRSWASTSQINNEGIAWSVYWATDLQNVVLQAGASDTLIKSGLLPVRAVRCEGPGVCPEVSCTGGVDEDGDGLTDCDDPDCDSSGVCPEAICDDAVDNDVDGSTDCDDPDCHSSGMCEVSSFNCDDAVDNDGDGLTDCDDPNCSAASNCQVGPFLLPDTTTTPPICYDATGDGIDCASATCPGQDGFYTGCVKDPNNPNDPRLRDNGDGTVTDTCTGLTWQKVPAEGGAAFFWCDALAYCEELVLTEEDGFKSNQDAMTAGNTILSQDWRLPSLRELESIVDYRLGVPGPPYDPVFAGPGAGSSHWSSTSIAFTPEKAWHVFFGGGGEVREGSKTATGSRNRVRAVRGFSGLLPDTGQTLCYGAAGGVISCTDDSHPCFGQDGFYATDCSNDPRFTEPVPPDGTVTDTCTGLMWQKGDNGGTTFSWCLALDHCETTLEGFAGHNNWRLPNARELHSILNYGRQGPVLDAVFDPLAVSTHFWSSTSIIGNEGRAVSWDLYVGSTSAASKSEDLRNVRAVRDTP